MKMKTVLKKNQDMSMPNCSSIRSLHQNLNNNKNRYSYSNSEERKKRCQNHQKNQIKLNQLQMQNANIAYKYLQQLNNEYYFKNNYHNPYKDNQQKNVFNDHKFQFGKKEIFCQNKNTQYWKNRFQITKKQNENKREQKIYLSNYLKKTKKQEKILLIEYQKILAEYEILTKFLYNNNDCCQKKNLHCYPNVLQLQENNVQKNDEILLNKDFFLQAKMTQQTIDDELESNTIMVTPQYKKSNFLVKNINEMTKNIKQSQKGRTIKKNIYNPGHIWKKQHFYSDISKENKADHNHNNQVEFQQRRLNELEQKFQQIIKKFMMKKQGKCAQQTTYLDGQLANIENELSVFRKLIADPKKSEIKIIMNKMVIK